MGRKRQGPAGCLSESDCVKGGGRCLSWMFARLVCQPRVGSRNATCDCGSCLPLAQDGRVVGERWRTVKIDKDFLENTALSVYSARGCLPRGVKLFALSRKKFFSGPNRIKHIC